MVSWRDGNAETSAEVHPRRFSSVPLQFVTSLLLLLAVYGLLEDEHPAPPHLARLRRLTTLLSGPSYQLGTVSEMYTFGAPSTAYPALEDLQRPDGCFHGLRSYNENILGVNNESKQIDAASLFSKYPHARIATVALHEGLDSYYVPCPGNPRWPEQGAAIYEEWRVHFEKPYTDRLNHITVHGEDLAERYPFKQARIFVLLAFKSYDSPEHTIAELAQRLPGWSLVAREVYSNEEKGSLHDDDPVMIVQDGSSLDCALVFTGTNNIGNELVSSTTDYSTGYCGYTNVHVGYRNELWTITKNLWPKLRPKLEKCNRVICVGHSMGGALCDLFSACANSKRGSDPDYRQQMWRKGLPAKMPQMTV